MTKCNIDHVLLLQLARHTAKNIDPINWKDIHVNLETEIEKLIRKEMNK